MQPGCLKEENVDSRQANFTVWKAPKSNAAANLSQVINMFTVFFTFQKDVL